MARRRLPRGVNGETEEESIARLMRETAPEQDSTLIPQKRSAESGDSADEQSTAVQDTETRDPEPTTTSESGSSAIPSTAVTSHLDQETTATEPLSDTQQSHQSNLTHRIASITVQSMSSNGASTEKTVREEQRTELTVASIDTQQGTKRPTPSPAQDPVADKNTTVVQTPAKRRKQSGTEETAFSPKPATSTKAKGGCAKRKSSVDVLDEVPQEEPRRSGRQRGVPRDRYVETLVEERSKPKAARGKGGAGRGNASGGGRGRRKLNLDQLFEPEILCSKRSPWIEKIDVANVLSQDFMENHLTEEQRAKVISWLPEFDLVYESEPKDGSNPDQAPKIDHRLWGNTIFKDAVANWRNDLSEGKYEKAYVEKAKEARRRRIEGQFDDWKDGKYEAFWGQKQKVNYDAIAGESSKVTLETLLEHGAFKVGDIFAVRRGFSGGLVVKKEAKFISITENNLMTFSYPSGTNEWEKAGVENKFIKNVDSMTRLENALIKEDGRVEGRIPNGNAFKTMRIIRNGEDIGSIFDVRAKFHQQYLTPAE